MWLSTTRSLTNVFGPQASWISCARVSMPAARANECLQRRTPAA